MPLVTVELTVNGSADPAGRYLTWTPYPAQLRLVAADNALDPVAVLLRNAPGNVGRLAFRTSVVEDGESETSLALPLDGSPVGFLVSGEFLAPSVDDGDAVLQAVVDGEVVAEIPFMVRVRKDAETLTDRERDRFVSAFAALNNRGLGLFRGFHAMHTEDTNDEAHGLDAFLPWHRAYLLDLERELQLIDPAVTLPYWRFDEPAPRLFSPDFMGAPSGRPSVGGGAPPALSAANPLRAWTIDGAPGIDRHPRFADPRVSAASTPAGPHRRPGAHAAAVLGPGEPRLRLRGRLPRRGQRAGLPRLPRVEPARRRPRQLLRLHPLPRHRRRRPAVLPAALQRRPDLGAVAVARGAVRRRGREHVLLPRPLRRPRRDPDRPQPARHDVAVERRDRRPAAATAPRQPLLASRGRRRAAAACRPSAT